MTRLVLCALSVAFVGAAVALGVYVGQMPGEQFGTSLEAGVLGGLGIIFAYAAGSGHHR